MGRRVRGHLSYANVVASLALFVALGGVSYAAMKLPKGSVGSTQIKKDAVTGAKVRNGSLTGSDIRNRSLTAADFQGSVQGPQGVPGKDGPSGVPGQDGTALGYAMVSGGPTLNSAASKNVTQANVVSVTPGYFCFVNLPFTAKVASVTLTHPTTATASVNVNNLLVSARVGSDPVCPAGSQASVVVNDAAGTLTNAQFQVVFN